MQQAYNNAGEKLCRYMSDEQPTICFLKEVRVFDPRHTAFMDSTVSSYKHIPGFSAVPQNELDAYLNHLGPSALKASQSVER